MWNYVVAAMVGVPITVLYLLSIVCIAAFPASFACYSYDTFGFLVNGIIGIVGFVFYMLNAAVTGEVTPMDELLHCPNDTCAKRDLIVLYAVISSVRFLSWYAEFFISFVYILFCLRYAVAMTLLRYVTHSFTAATSIVTLCLVSLRRFPHDELYGSSLVVPIIIQLLIFFYTLLSFLLIQVDKVERKTDGITTIVIDKAKDASLLPGSEDDDVSIWTQSKSTKANEIAFLHVPDLQNISSHMVAVYKIETPAFAYLTYMTT